MSLIENIQINSLSEAYEILKGIGVDDNLFEKAHKDGDLHPNGKWVWVSSAAGGKGDWRTLNGRTHKKYQASSAAGSATTANSGSSSGSGNSNGGKVGDKKSDTVHSTTNAVNKVTNKQKFTTKDYEHWGHASTAKSYGLFNADTNLASIVTKDKINSGFIVTIKKQKNKYADGSIVETKIFSSRKQAMEYGIQKIQEKSAKDKVTSSSKKSVNDVTKDEDDPNVILDNFNKEYKITSLQGNGIPTALSNYAFGLSSNKKNKDYPWLDNIGTADQRKAITYEIASSIKFGAYAVANRLNASNLGYNNWEVVTKNPLKIKSEDRKGNVNYILIQKVKSDKPTTSKKTTKQSAFVFKTIDRLKSLIELSDDKLKKLSDIISKDESTAKKILSAKFSAVGPVNKYLPHNGSKSITQINDNEELVLLAEKNYNSTSRNPALRGTPTTHYYIYLRERGKNSLGLRLGSAGSYRKKAAEAKSNCVMEAFYNYYNRKNNL